MQLNQASKQGSIVGGYGPCFMFYKETNKNEFSCFRSL